MALIDFSLGDVGNVITSIREAFTGKKITDPIEAAKIEMQLATLENALLTGQLEINKAEAQHPSIFVAGWRPFIGWGCGFALLYATILEPFIRFVATVGFGYYGAYPEIDTSLTMQALLGMLGLGAMRSFDKQKGSDTKVMK